MSIIKSINDDRHCFIKLLEIDLHYNILAMPTNINPVIREVIEAVHYRPAVSIIMPFEPKMYLKKTLTHSLKTAVDKVAIELKKNYPDEQGQVVIKKLRSIIEQLDFNTYKKSIAIFTSPIFEKTLYLDIAVEEKIIIDESFEIRDLIYSKKQLHKYLILLLSNKSFWMYVGNTQSFVRIISNTPESVFDYENDIPERVANFSDLNKRKEIMMEKFLYHIDNTLDIILKSYNLPLFILGTDRIAGHFKKLTRHSKAVIDYVHGNFEEASITTLKNILNPYVKDWKKVIEINTINKLEEARNRGKLSIGMRDVWKDVTGKKGRLLVIEKNYMYAAEQGATEDNIYKATETYNKFSYIKDAVDDVIEKVLENGGDVEFTDEGILKDYKHIALIKFY